MIVYKRSFIIVHLKESLNSSTSNLLNKKCLIDFDNLLVALEVRRENDHCLDI